MALDPVTNTVGTGSLQAAGVSQQDFLKILLTQLTQQDPLKPMDNTQFVAQLAQFSQLEQTQQLNDSVSTSLATQIDSQAFALLGKTVTISSTGTSGTVSAIDFRGSSPTLTIKSTSGQSVSAIPISQVIGANN